MNSNGNRKQDEPIYIGICKDCIHRNECGETENEVVDCGDYEKEKYRIPGR